VVLKTDTEGITFGHHTLLVEYALMAASVAFVALGFWLAYKLYLENPKRDTKLAASWPRLHNFLMHKYYVDEIYDALFVNRIEDLGTRALLLRRKSHRWHRRRRRRLGSRASFPGFPCGGTNGFVDALVNTLGWFPKFLSMPVRMFQTGVLLHLRRLHSHRHGNFAWGLRPPRADVCAPPCTERRFAWAFLKPSPQRDPVHAAGGRAAPAIHSERIPDSPPPRGHLFGVLGFLVSLPLMLHFPSGSSGYEFKESADWIPSIGAKYSLGADGISNASGHAHNAPRT